MTVCLSPNGPKIARLDSAPRRLLVATIRGIGIVEREGADTPWRLVARTIETSHVSSIAALPGGRGIVAGAHSGGLFFSSDEGNHWERRTKGLTIEHVFSLNAVEAGDRALLYAGTEPVSLFRSDDCGETWCELPTIRQVPGTEKWTFPPPPHIAHTKAITFDPTDRDRMYACIEQGALLTSDDGGQNWHEIDSYCRPDDRLFRDIHNIAVIPSNPDELIMTTGIGLYRSSDAGRAWEKLTGCDARISYPDHLIVSPMDDKVIFITGSQNPPSKWRTSHMAAGTVMVSRDRGQTWSEAAEGLPRSRRPNLEAMCAAVWPGGFMLFVGTTDGEIYSSEDAARSWQLVADGLAPVSKGGHFRFLQPGPSAA